MEINKLLKSQRDVTYNFIGLINGFEKLRFVCLKAQKILKVKNMGTFGTGIFDSDNFFDTHFTFFYKFFIGVSIKKIIAEIKKEYDYKQESFEEEYFADLERDDYLVSMLNCLWHIGKTDNAMVENVERIINSENSLQNWKEQNRKDRKEALKEFLIKISKPKYSLKVFLFFAIRVLLYPFLFPLRFISIEKLMEFLGKIWQKMSSRSTP